jgi:hypothetical protein
MYVTEKSIGAENKNKKMRIKMKAVTLPLCETRPKDR